MTETRLTPQATFEARIAAEFGFVPMDGDYKGESSSGPDATDLRVLAIAREADAALRTEREARERAERDAAQCIHPAEREVVTLRAEVEALKQERDAARQALVKVRAHTGYVNPTIELLSGLLTSIERIVDATLPADPRGET